MLKRSQLSSGADEAKSRWLYSLGGVFFAAGLYSALHIAARLIASANLGEDDPLEAILTQTLQLGYLPGQPPLYDWLLWLLEQVTGPGALGFQLLKYGLLTGTCAFIFLAARQVMKGDALWAFLSVEALALIYQISWRFHEGFTHAVGAMCAVAACFWALLRVIEEQRAGDYAVFGLVLGLGILTVPTFWVYLAALLAAACIQSAIRRRLLDRRSLLTFGLAALIAAPYFIWLAGTPDGIGAALPSFAADDFAEHARLAADGVSRAFTEPIMYLAPLIFIYPLFFPAMLKTSWREVSLHPNKSAKPDFEHLILHMTLLSVAALIAGAVIFGIHRYPTHGLMPLFLISSIWLTAQARRAARNQAQIRRFVLMALSVAVFAFFARAANMYVLEPVCLICRWGIPYAELAAEMKQRGFERGRIFVTDRELGGNLRRFFPDSSITLVGKLTYSPPEKSSSTGFENTVLVWSTDEKPERVLQEFRAFHPELQASELALALTIRIPWRGHIWKPDGYRISSWRILLN